MNKKILFLFSTFLSLCFNSPFAYGSPNNNPAYEITFQGQGVFDVLELTTDEFDTLSMNNRILGEAQAQSSSSSYTGPIRIGFHVLDRGCNPEDYEEEDSGNVISREQYETLRNSFGSQKCNCKFSENEGSSGQKRKREELIGPNKKPRTSMDPVAGSSSSLFYKNQRPTHKCSCEEKSGKLPYDPATDLYLHCETCEAEGKKIIKEAEDESCKIIQEIPDLVQRDELDGLITATNRLEQLRSILGIEGPTLFSYPDADYCFHIMRRFLCLKKPCHSSLCDFQNNGPCACTSAEMNNGCHRVNLSVTRLLEWGSFNILYHYFYENVLEPAKRVVSTKDSRARGTKPAIFRYFSKSSNKSFYEICASLESGEADLLSRDREGQTLLDHIFESHNRSSYLGNESRRLRILYFILNYLHSLDENSREGLLEQLFSPSEDGRTPFDRVIRKDAKFAGIAIPVLIRMGGFRYAFPNVENGEDPSVAVNSIINFVRESLGYGKAADSICETLEKVRKKLAEKYENHRRRDYIKG